MTATILDAIQDIATPAMIKAATSALGVSDSHATTGLAAAATSILGGLLQKSGDAGVMSKVASLIGATTPDASMFANMSSMLAGGVPASPIQTLGNKLLGTLFGDKMAAMMAAVASATGISSKASSGLTTLAAPMVLAALRNKLGGAPTAASLAGLLSTDKGAIAGAMPPALRAMYGLTSLAPSAAAAKPAAPSVAATVAPVVAAAAPVAAAVAATAPKPAAPAAHSSSGYASTTVTSAAPVAPAPKPATPVAAPAPAPAARVAPVAATVATAAPAAAAHAHGHSQAAKPAAPAVPAGTAAYHASHEVADSGAHMGTKIALLGGLALLTALIWYMAYGRTPAPVAPAPKPVAAVAPAPAPAAKPAPAPVAVAPTPAAAPAPAAPASTQMVAVPGANGLVKYTLPGGASIEVAKDGLESKMLTFINTKDAAIDNKLWFDFDRLSFVTASSELTPESKAQVSSAVAILKAYPAVSVKVGGYTDNQGNADANLKLSDQRANRVMEEMVAGGVAPDRIEAKGYGDQHPVGDNETAEGRAKNRRTSLSIRTK